MNRFILIDTNLLAEKTRLLRTGLGPSLLYVAKVRDAKLAVPAVVKTESTRYAMREVIGLCEAATDSLRQLREYLGDFWDAEMPSEADVLEAIERRFAELSPWMHEIPQTDDLIRASADRVLSKIAPSHRDGEDAFRDSVIWESLLTLPAGSAIYFGSADVRAFFSMGEKKDARGQNSRGDEKKTRFSEFLMDEAASRGLTLHPFRDLESLVKSLQGDQPLLDRERARSTIGAAMAEHVIAAMGRWGIEELHDDDFHMDAYMTEKAGILYVQFTASYKAAVAMVDNIPYDATKLTFLGQCMYDPHGHATELRISRESLLTADGREVSGTAVAYMDGVVSLWGRSRRRHSIRIPLPAT